MTRVRITGGFLNVGRRKPGHHPDQGLPGTEDQTDPDYGVDEGAGIDNELPDPPPGIWPPLTPEQPWRPIDPGFGTGGRPPRPDQGLPRPGVGGRPDQGLPGAGGEHPEHPIFQPGTIWPPLPPGVHGKYWALVLVKGSSGVTYRYVVIDADARPEHPMEPPDEEPPAPQPKKA